MSMISTRMMGETAFRVNEFARDTSSWTIVFARVLMVASGAVAALLYVSAFAWLFSWPFGHLAILVTAGIGSGLGVLLATIFQIRAHGNETPLIETSRSGRWAGYQS